MNPGLNKDGVIEAPPERQSSIPVWELDWQMRVSEEPELHSTLRPRGRPKIEGK